MATLTADRRRFVQRSLLDPHEEERALRRPQPQSAPPARPAHVDPQPRAEEPRPTFEDLVAGTWDALVVSHTATCLVCGGDLAPRWSAGPRPVGGRCLTCGTELS
jgi:hypothetical protein